MFALLQPSYSGLYKPQQKQQSYNIRLLQNSFYRLSPAAYTTTAMHMVQLVLIDNNDSFTYNIVQTLARYGCRATVRAHSSFTIEEAAHYDKIIFSPGPGTPDEYPIMAALLEHYGSTKSILGVCLGHQAIAMYYGARLINLASVYHGQRRCIDILDSSDTLFSGIASGTPVGLYHSWAVAPESVPEHLRITSVSEDGIVMSIAHSQYDIRGVQFHPESIITDEGHRMLANWLAH